MTYEPHVQRRLGVAGLLLASAVLLTLSTAAYGQWYLAWVGLAPWLVAVAGAATSLRAALRGWIGGVLFFGMNLWWLWTASIPGTFVLIAYEALYWGAAAATLHGLGLLTAAEGAEPATPGWDRKLGNKLGMAGRLLVVAAIWVAFEWLRCNVYQGFPWLPIGVTQSPIVVMCQVADLGGPLIVSFWLAAINALAALALLHRGRWRLLTSAAAAVAVVIAAVAAYGVYRVASTQTRPGPRVLAVQSNFRNLPGGASTASPQETVEFLLAELGSQLATQKADLAVLPEAAFPPINSEARRELERAPAGAFLNRTYQRVVDLSRQGQVAILVGGNAVTGWKSDGSARVGAEIRNSAYYFQPAETSEQRYDKIHLVAFSERAPFANGPQWLRRAGLAIAAGRAVQPLTAGNLETLEPFELVWRRAGDDGVEERLRFISPICLEAVAPRVIAAMMRQPAGEAKVDMIANLSSDGWFAVQEKHLHLQSVVFRAIEHRVPLVRASNTGISGWIDSIGRIRDVAAANVSGTIMMQIELDDRMTPYAKYGDVFAGICLGIAALAIAVQYGFSARRGVARSQR